MPDWISPDVLKLAVVAIAGAGYAAYKTGLIERLGQQRGEELPRYGPRPIFSPSRIRFERAVLDVCGIDQLQLIRTTARLRGLGFWIVGDFWMPAPTRLGGINQQTFARAMVSADDPIYAIAVQRNGHGAPPPFVDFITLFTDMTFLTATNSEEGEDPGRPGALRFHRLAGLTPDELYQHHRANLEALRSNWLKAVPVSRDSFFAHYRQWLAVDSELRRSRDEEVRKDHIVRALDSLPPLDIGPILRRYDGQRVPLDLAKSRSAAGGPLEPPSPTIIRDPERAPIRRRVPGAGIPAAMLPSQEPASETYPAEPTFGDALSTQPSGFQDYFQPAEVAQAHPLDLLDRLDAAAPPPASPGTGAAGANAGEDFDYAGAFEGPSPDQASSYADPDTDIQEVEAQDASDIRMSLRRVQSWRPPDAESESAPEPAAAFPDPTWNLGAELPLDLPDDGAGSTLEADPPLPFETGPDRPVAAPLRFESNLGHPLAQAPVDAGPSAPARCPHCRARTLTRYSQRCHKCRQLLVEAMGDQGS